MEVPHGTVYFVETAALLKTELLIKVKIRVSANLSRSNLQSVSCLSCLHVSLGCVQPTSVKLLRTDLQAKSQRSEKPLFVVAAHLFVEKLPCRLQQLTGDRRRHQTRGTSTTE